MPETLEVVPTRFYQDEQLQTWNILKDMMSRQPLCCSEKALKTWNMLGPIDIDKIMLEGPRWAPIILDCTHTYVNFDETNSWALNGGGVRAMG